MSKSIISANNAPEALGPYSQAVKANGFLFTSGQLPSDMSDGHIEFNDIALATKYCLNNIKAILAADGLTMNHIVKTTIFLSDINDFTAVNKAYGEYFLSAPPARSCVQAAAIPKNAPIEIEAIAFIG